MKKVSRIILSFIFYTTPVFAQDISGAYTGIGKKDVAEVEASLNFSSAPDKQCFDMQASLCPTPNPPFVGIKLRYWAPEFLMESVKAPGEYILRDQSVETRKTELLEASRKAVRVMSHDDVLEPSSGSSYQDMNGGGLQFNEVHILPFKPGVLLDLACFSFLPNVYPFYSEKNTESWRTGKGEVKWQWPKIGLWGPLFPRTGFMIHSSPMTASIATCIKGVDRMHPELGIATEVPLLIDKVQLIYPSKSSCIHMGINLTDMERSFYSKDGRYVWTYWHYHECCRSISG